MNTPFFDDRFDECAKPFSFRGRNHDLLNEYAGVYGYLFPDAVQFVGIVKDGAKLQFMAESLTLPHKSPHENIPRVIVNVEIDVFYAV